MLGARCRLSLFLIELGPKSIISWAFCRIESISNNQECIGGWLNSDGVYADGFNRNVTFRIHAKEANPGAKIGTYTTIILTGEQAESLAKNRCHGPKVVYKLQLPKNDSEHGTFQWQGLNCKLVPGDIVLQRTEFGCICMNKVDDEGKVEQREVRTD